MPRPNNWEANHAAGTNLPGLGPVKFTDLIRPGGANAASVVDPKPINDGCRLKGSYPYNPGHGLTEGMKSLMILQQVLITGRSGGLHIQLFGLQMGY